MSITIENPTAEAFFAALQNVPTSEVERLRAFLNAQSSAPADDEEVARKQAELAALLNEGLNSPALPFTRELWTGLLAQVDAEAKEKGLESGLLADFLARNPEQSAR